MSLALNPRRQAAGLRAGPLLLAAAGFAAGLAAGLAAGALVAPVAAGRAGPPPVSAAAAPAVLRAVHPAQVLRVIDGDTFAARVRIWPGMDVTTKVRLRGIDAPELHARCAGERARAVEARETLGRLLNEGAVGIAGVRQDKYGGRVDADVSTAATPDVAAAMLKQGLVRRYAGGRRAGWCG
jgi:endonuclease YncB( thermonuclease family)